jgi:hypothetical protein
MSFGRLATVTFGNLAEAFVCLVNRQFQLNKCCDHCAVRSLNNIRRCTRGLSEGTYLGNDLLHSIGCSDIITIRLQLASLLDPMLPPGNKFNDLSIQLINFRPDVLNTKVCHAAKTTERPLRSPSRIAVAQSSPKMSRSTCSGSMLRSRAHSAIHAVYLR